MMNIQTKNDIHAEMFFLSKLITKTVSFWTSIQGGQTIRIERSTVLDLDVISLGAARNKAYFTSFPVHNTFTNGRKSAFK